MIGHLQSNKGRRAAELFDAVDSVDDATLAKRLERGAEAARRQLPVLIQVDLGQEATKFGLDEAHLFPTLEQLRGYKAVRVEGLMVLPPLALDPRRRVPTSAACASSSRRRAARAWCAGARCPWG
jgi:uncharacterized pyridoxal phosphate-containing UPF0001 family protein